MLTELNTLINQLNALVPDATKHDQNNKAAGTRLRVGLQEVKAKAQLLREKVLTEQKGHVS